MPINPDFSPASVRAEAYSLLRLLGAGMLTGDHVGASCQRLLACAERWEREQRRSEPDHALLAKFGLAVVRPALERG